MPARYLPIYLNDHLAALTAGVAVARRTRDENEGELWEALDRLHAELADDRRELVALMRRLGIRPSAAKAAGGRVAERLGRLKPNGHLRSYSPLSRLEELEALAALAEHTLALWQSLRDAGVDVGDGVLERARRRRGLLEPHRRDAAQRALG